MFMPYAAVPVVAFTILLNFLWFYMPLVSSEQGYMYNTCEGCKLDDCYTKLHRPCFIRFNKHFNFTCFWCAQKDGFDQFYSKKDCEDECTDSKMVCHCVSACYRCIPTALKVWSECDIDERFPPLCRIDSHNEPITVGFSVMFKGTPRAFVSPFGRKDCLNLIEAFRLQEVLWYSKNPSYFSKNAKHDAWCHLAKELKRPVEEIKLMTFL
ncbi:hypothetical protein QTP88_007582 [Uroleucon formosanum]